MRIFLIALCGLTIVLIACDPASTTNRTPAQPAEPTPALLLTEDSAISILQAYLQDCVLSWDRAYKGRVAYRENLIVQNEDPGLFSTRVTPGPTISPPPPEREQKRLLDLATKSFGGIAWSAQYHGVTELPNSFDRMSGEKVSSETWVVIGPGFERAGSDLETVPGRWKVYAGHRQAFYLDAPARLAFQEYDVYNTCHIQRVH